MCFDKNKAIHCREQNIFACLFASNKVHQPFGAILSNCTVNRLAHWAQATIDPSLNWSSVYIIQNHPSIRTLTCFYLIQSFLCCANCTASTIVCANFSFRFSGNVIGNKRTVLSFVILNRGIPFRKETTRRVAAN